MLLNGFGFAGYRSFGNELAVIAPLKKINFIIGQNNSGKSNIIRFLHEQLPRVANSIQTKTNRLIYTSDYDFIVANYKDEDYPLKRDDLIYKVAFTFNFDTFKNVIKPKIDNDIYRRSNLNVIINPIDNFEKKLIEEFDTFLFTEKKLPLIVFGYIPTSKESFLIRDNLQLIKANSNLFIKAIGAAYTAKASEFSGDLLNNIFLSRELIVKLIPAIRQVALTEKNIYNDNDFSGLGLIDKLAKIQNPAYTEQRDKQKFEEINQFVQVVLENTTARIEIPHQRDMILVHMDSKTLPLESLGTGIHEVIIIAAAATMLDNTVLCIEEPELHMHPVLQRKLIRYLNEHTTNQYLLTTHSAHLLDAVDDTSIFHVTLKNGQSHVEAITTNSQKIDICKSLGYKASDLLQTNCIIWVEGPSDRIYINYWIKGKRADLVEGVHYSIMFYGGRLASHLTGCFQDEQAETAIDELINLRSLNTHAVIVMDSDKASSYAKVNKTKQRLYKEFGQGDGFAWVTKGREIENYLGDDKVEKCVLKAHPLSAKALENKGDWSNLLKYVLKDEVKKKKNQKNKDKVATIEKVPTADKVKVAEKYIEDYKDVDYSKLDLGKKVNELVKFILECNDKK